MSEINISEVTAGTVDGIGYFDKLMQSATVHLDTQWKLNRLKGSDYATVYLGLTQTVLQQSLTFALGRQQADKQADLLVVQANTTQAQSDSTIALQASQQAKADYEVANLLPEQLIKIQEEIDLLGSQDLELLNSTLRANTQLNDQLTTTAIDRDVKTRGIIEQESTGTKQRILLDTDEELKQFEVDSINPEKLVQIQEQIDLLVSQDLDVIAKTAIAVTQSSSDISIKTRGMVEQESTGIKQRLVLDEQIIEIQEKVDLLGSQDLDTIAKTAIANDQSTKDLMLKTEQIAASSVETSLKQEQSTKDLLVKQEQIDSAIAQQGLIANQTTTETNKATDVAKSTLVKTAQIDSMIIEDVLKTTELNDKILTNTKQRSLLDTEEELKQYEHDSIQPKQLDKITEEIALLQSQGLDVVKGTLVKDEQITSSSADTSIKQAQSIKDLLLKTEQITASTADTSIKQAQSDKDLLVKQEQITASNVDTGVKHNQSNKDLLLKQEQIKYSKFNRANDVYKTLSAVYIELYKLKQIDDLPTALGNDDTIDAVYTALVTYVENYIVPA